MSNRRRRTDQEIEERIVSMRFENQQFQAASKETMKRLTDLEGALDGLGRSSAGLDSFSMAINNVGRGSTLGAMADNVDNIARHFTWWGRTVDHIADSITSRVLRMAERTGAAIAGLTNEFFGFDPGMQGFKEYENMMTSIQTIKTNTASHGTTVDEITDALAELNTYADRTIYSFQEMTKNIGTFTASGVELDQAVLAIKGIANLGAGVGSTPAQVANAMYQLSQALAAGKVQLQDWNSVVNAGMGGEYFQNALKDAAREIAAERGIIVKEFEGTFRESISGGDSWITSDVLMRALTKFAEDPALEEAATKVKSWTQLVDTLKESIGSGWSETWQYVFGNLDEASELFTFLSETIDSLIKPVHDARNNMLKFWHDYGGRDSAFRAIVNIMNTLKSIIYTIGDAWRTWFPPQTGEGLIELTERFEAFTEAIYPSEESLERLWYTVSGFFQFLRGVADFLGTIRDGVMGAIRIVASIVIPSLERVLDLFGGLSDWVIGFLRPLGILSEKIDGVERKLSPAVKILYVLKDIAVAIGEAFLVAGALIVDTLNNLGFGDIIRWFGSMAESARAWLASLTASDVIAFFGKLKSKTIEWYEVLKDRFPMIQKLEDILKSNIPTLDKITSGIKEAGGMIKYVINLLKGMREWLSEKFTWVASGAFKKDLTLFKSDVEEKLESITGLLEKFKIGWKAFTDFLSNTSDHLKTYISPLWKLFVEQIKDLFSVLSNLSLYDLITLISIWEGIQFFKGFKATFTGLGSILENVAKVVESANKIVVKFGKFIDAARGTLKAFRNKLNADAFITFAIAVGILAASIVALTLVDTEKAIPGLKALATMVISMIGVMALLAFAASEDWDVDTKPILYLAAAVGIMAAAMYGLGKSVDSKKLDQAAFITASLIGLLGVIAILLALVNGKTGGGMRGSMIGMISLAAAVYLLIGAIHKLALDNTENLELGMLRLGGILISLGIFFALAIHIGEMSLSAGIGLVIAAFALGKVVDVAKALRGSHLIGIDDGLKRLYKTIGLLALVFGVLGAIVKGGAFGNKFIMTQTGAKQLIAIGRAMAIMFVGLASITASFALLKDMDASTLKAAGDAISTIIFMAGAFVVATKYSDAQETGGTFLAMAAGVLAMAAAMKIMLGVDWGTMGKIASVLGGMIVAAMILGKFAPNLDKFTDSLGKFAKTLLIGVAALLGLGIIFSATGPLLAIIAAGANSIVNYLATIGTAILSLIIQLGEPLVMTAAVLLMDLLDGLTIYLPDFMDALVGLCKQIWEIGLGNLWDYIMMSIASGIGSIGEWLNNELLTLIDGLLGWIPGVSDWVLNQQLFNDEAYDLFQSRLRAKYNLKKNERALAQAQKNNANEARDRMQRRKEEALAALGTLQPDDMTAMETLAAGSASLNEIMKQVPTADNVANSLSKNVGDIINNVDVSQYAGTLGLDTVEGFASGILDSTNLSEDAMKELANSSLTALQEELDIHSPSEKTRQLGKMAIEGLHLALVDGRTVIYDDSYAIGIAIMTGIADALNQPTDSIVYTPSIAPVVDLSKVRYSYASDYKLPNLSEPTATVPSLAYAVNSEVETNSSTTSGTDEELIGLRSDFAALAKRLERMEVRLDDGALVGALAPKLDSELADLNTVSQRSGR